jgi:hypothetical protein
LFTNEESLVKIPMIEISVGEGMVINTILDTGSEINLLAGSVYEKRIKLGADVPTLLLENVTNWLLLSGRSPTELRSKP